MAKQKQSTITKEQLLANGWIETGDPIVPIKKCLTDKTAERYVPEAGDLHLILHCYQNSWTIALSLPDGGMVNINVASIKELNTFERSIAGYDPSY